MQCSYLVTRKRSDHSWWRIISTVTSIGKLATERFLNYFNFSPLVCLDFDTHAFYAKRNSFVQILRKTFFLVRDPKTTEKMVS